MQNKHLPHIFLRHLAASLLIVITFTIAGYVWSEQQIYRANNLRYQFFLLADELRQSSDGLTRMAQAYVATGDPLYKKNYQTILDIRDGKRPRPERYQNIYWDLEPNEQTSSHGVSGQAIPLLELIRQAGFSEDEYRKLAQAKANSDALTATELKAMQLVETTGPEAVANRTMALTMLHDDKYYKAKSAIMKPINELMEKRAFNAVQAAIDKAMILRGVFIVFGLGLMLMLWRINKALHVFLGGSVDEIYAQIVKIGCGDISSPILVADGRENCVMGWLAKAQVNLNKIDDERKLLENDREEALNLLQKIASQVPGVVYQYRLRPDGGSCFPFASEAIREIFRVSPEEVREDASKAFAILHLDDYDETVASIRESAQDLSPWHHKFRVKFDDGTVRWLLGNAIPQREADGSVLWHGFITDITKSKLEEEALQRSEQQFRTLAEALPQIVWITRPDGWNIYYNQHWVDFTGLTLEESYGHGWRIPIHPDDRQRARDAWQHATQTDSNYSLECRLRRADGIYRWWLIRAVSLHDANGKIVNWFGTCTDIQDIKESEEKLQLAASVFTHAREGIMITAPDGAIIDVNDAFCGITGYSRDEVLGQNPRLLSSGRQEEAFYSAMWRDLITQGCWSGEIWNRRKNGALYAEMLTISAVRDAQGKARHYVALFTDISLHKEHERRLEHSAHFDALTSLPNRELLVERLHQAMVQTRRRGQRLAVGFLDLDGFKTINDNHGHEAGDQLLVAAATRMKQTLREGDTFARLGGDEFVAVFLDLADIEATVPMLTRLLTAAAQPVHVDDLVLRVSASIGVTFYPQAEDIDADQLLRQADQAMYQAKLAGKNRYHFFDAEQDSRIRSHHESLERIRRALAEREFVLYYQPKVNMRRGTVIGAEALIRWEHPERGLLPPAVFLPTIEDHPLAVDIGEWVIDTALTQMDIWQAAGLNIPVSVNIGSRQLQQTDFVERLRVLLAAHPNVRPGYLELEVLETSALEDLVRVSQIIEDCREIGVSFTLDDFGTGYSSLTYLKRLHVTQIKIDQSFVRDMLDSPDDLAILEGVLGMAAAFQHQVIAEGVETVELGEMLLQFDCELAQGYGIAPPMPAQEMSGWSSAWQTDPSWGGLPAMSREDFPLLVASVEHRAWITALEAFLKGEHEVRPPMDPHQCRFGRWLDDKGLIRYGAKPAFHTIELLHLQVHVLGAELLELQARGRNPEALARLGELHDQRDSLLKHLKKLALENSH